MTLEVKRPYITQMEGVAGRKPIITGTRTPVRSIVAYHLMGNAPEEIQTKLPYLTLAQIHDALSFYYDHREEIDADLDANREECVRQATDL